MRGEPRTARVPDVRYGLAFTAGHAAVAAQNMAFCPAKSGATGALDCRQSATENRVSG
jgi:hypothetical protein